MTGELASGTVVGGCYTLDERLGTGGQGEVWRGVDRDGQARAIKRFAGPDAVSDVLADGLVAANLAQHAHLVRTIDAVKHGAALLVVMELVEGRRLSELCPIADEELFASVLVHVGAALAHLHGTDTVPGVAHRDVKPDNILVRTGVETGTGLPHATLVDLGLLLALDGSRNERHGVPEFTAPDVLLSARYVAEDDVYSLGAVGWYMLCGDPPHSAAGLSKQQFARRVVTRRLSEVEHDLPAWAMKYEDVLAQALIVASPHPSRRHGERRPSAAQLIAAVAEVAWSLTPPAPIAELLSRARTGIEGAAERPMPVDLATPALPGPGLLELARRRARAPRVAVRGGGLSAKLGHAALEQRAGRSTEAVAGFRAAAGAGSAYAMVRAAEELQGSDPGEARRLLELADEQGSGRAALLLGRLLAQDDPAAALSAFERATQRSSADGAWEWTTALRRAGREQEAAEALAIAVELHHPQASQHAAEAAEQAGRVSEAVRLYERAGTAVAAWRLGLVHQRRGDLTAAERCLLSAWDSGCTEAWRPLVEVHNELPGRDPWAQLRSAADAGLPGAQVMLGKWLTWRQPDDAEANALLRRALTDGDGGEPDPEVRVSLAISELGCGRPHAAAQLLAPGEDDATLPQPSAAVVEAAAHHAAGDREAALRAVARASFRQNDDPWARRVAEPALRDLAEDSPVAAFQCADALRQRLVRPWSEQERDELVALYERSCASGDPSAYAMLGWASAELEARHAALVTAATGGNGWAMYELASADGDPTDPWLLRGVDAGHRASLRYLGDLLVEDDPDRALELLRAADRAGDPYAARSLAWVLVSRVGWRDAEVEAALSRADQRGHGTAADELGTLIWDLHRDAEAALAAHLRAARRGVGDGWVNAGVVYESIGDEAAGEDAYRRAIAHGCDEGKAWLASIVRRREGVDAAVELAREGVAAEPDGAVVHWLLAELLGAQGEVEQQIEHLRRADALGHAWSAYELSHHLEPADAHAALDRALARATDVRDPLYPYVANKHELIRSIARRRAALPHVGAPRVRLTDGPPGMLLRVRLPPPQDER